MAAVQQLVREPALEGDWAGRLTSQEIWLGSMHSVLTEGPNPTCCRETHGMARDIMRD